MNNSRFSVYRGDFRKSIKACEFTHVGVFMRPRRTDSRFAASRISCRYQAGNAGAYDLVCMPAMRDLGSLHYGISTIGILDSALSVHSVRLSVVSW